jgi:hypothetical protein
MEEKKIDVVAKFLCTRNEAGGVQLTAAAGPGNEQWSAATPSGSIQMTITNSAALDAFEVGVYYEVTLRPIVQ